MSNMKRVISLCLMAFLLICLPTVAFADDGFNASLNVDRNVAGQIAVTVVHSSVLETLQPELSIPCDASYSGAMVFFNGTAWKVDYADGYASFTVAEGGTYYIVIGAVPTESTPATCVETGKNVYVHNDVEYTETVGETGHDFTDTGKETCANCSMPNPNYDGPNSCVNVQTGVYYEDLSDALAEVDGTEAVTIQLLKDESVAESVQITPNVTLDLNGFALTTDFAITFGDSAFIVDSKDGEGLLQVAKGNLHLAASGRQMPIYDDANAGYRIYNVELKDYTVQTFTNKYVYWFTLEFTNKQAYELLQQTDCGDVSAISVISWGNNQSLKVSFRKDVLQKFARAKSEGLNYGLNVTVIGVSSVEGEVKCELSILSGTSARQTAPALSASKQP